MLLEEAFNRLLSRKAWYVGSGISRQNAFRDKKDFLSGKKIPEDRIRRYLAGAGMIQTQVEEWKWPWPGRRKL